MTPIQIWLLYVLILAAILFVVGNLLMCAALQILKYIEVLEELIAGLCLAALAPSLFIMLLALILEGLRSEKKDIQERNRKAVMKWLETKGFTFPDRPRCKGAA